MLDFLSVVECCVHIPIAVCVRDSLHRSGCRFSECQGSIDAVDDAEFILLSDLLSGIYFLLPFFPLCFFLVGTLLYTLLDEPEKKPVSADGILAATMIAVTSMRCTSSLKRPPCPDGP